MKRLGEFVNRESRCLRFRADPIDPTEALNPPDKKRRVIREQLTIATTKRAR